MKMELLQKQLQNNSAILSVETVIFLIAMMIVAGFVFYVGWGGIAYFTSGHQAQESFYTCYKQIRVVYNAGYDVTSSYCDTSVPSGYNITVITEYINNTYIKSLVLYKGSKIILKDPL